METLDENIKKIRVDMFLYYSVILSMYILGAVTKAEEVITNPQQFDGFGSQFQAIIASVIYAELRNKKFVYTPFQKMEHNYNGDPDFLTKKEELINFIGNFELNKDGVISDIYFKGFFDEHVAECANSQALKKIKKIFRANKKIDNYFNNNNLNIAIHLRRPNLHDNRITGADTPDYVFLNIINFLRLIYSSQNPLIHIYSQGDVENFKTFTAPDIVLHLNEELEDTFLAMVVADVLVVAPSSFSYTAGLLSDGTVYYIPFWHKPLPHWIGI